ncbi:MAG TPA: DddA-like double-stranded DNA deaminase toxin [Pseudonocardiaceae bacterium]|nr:DddA-like double-stranded DNA deaminase toxin [Pseudonocardiaceae bacterium]
MASVADGIAGLKAVLTQISTARRLLAGTGWDNAATTYRTTMAGSTRPEATEQARLDGQVQRQLSEADHLAARAATAIGEIITRLGGRPTQAVEQQARPSVTNQHGDRYPEEFGADTARSMPPRVRRGARNAEMMGYVTIDGREFGKLGATRGDPWAEQVRQRLRGLGLRRWLRLSHHVEMKAVAVLLSVGGRGGEVRINHAPCGYEPGDPGGCHQVLSDFIPRGESLTVLGTDANGEPFQHTYQGRAPR